MKTRILAFALAVAAFTMSFTNKATEYSVDSKVSKVTWLGKKVTGEHTGNINIAEGKLLSDGKNYTGGSFTIDMNSITNTDLKDEGYNKKLVGHLKSDDFFSTEKFPKSTLVITRVTPNGKDKYNIKGNLTIKGITNEIEFPATIVSSGKQLKASAKIIVNRAKFDVRYGSGSFFENLGDKTIYDDFELNVNLIANK